MNWLVLAVCLCAAASLSANAVLYARRQWTHRDPDACPGEAEDPLTPLHAAFAFSRECAASLAALGAMPLAPLGFPPTSGTAGRVVLVPGLLLNRGALRPLARRLADRGYEVYAFRGPLLGVGRAAAALALYLAELQRAEPREVSLVACGTGGLVARRWAAARRGVELGKLITIGTAHQGTWLAPRRSPLADLHPLSACIAELRAQASLPDEIDIVAIQSHFDAVVLPPENAYYPRAFNIQLRDLGHASLIFSSQVADLVVENLQG